MLARRNKYPTWPFANAAAWAAQYLLTALRTILANLLGLEIHDVALDRYVEVAARLSPVLTLTIPIVTLDPTRTLT